MSANLITGNLFKPIYAYQDADYQAGISGNVTSIMPVGSQMALSIEDANTIKADDGVLITKEGRRIQIDAGAIEEWSIPTGTQGQTNYYIVGFRLYTGDNSAELCETFVEQMENATDTIPEATFRGGATEVYISLGRVVQSGINLDSVTSLVQIAQSFEDVKNAISQLNNDLGSKSSASAVTGNDAFSKIATLNSDLSETKTNLSNLDLLIPTNASSTNKLVANSDISDIKKIGEMCEGYISSSSGISINTTSALVPVSNVLYNTDNALYQFTSNGITITKPGVYLVHGVAHCELLQYTGVEVGILSNDNQSLNLSSVTYYNAHSLSAQAKIGTTSIVYVSSGGINVHLRVVEHMNNSGYTTNSSKVYGTSQSTATRMAVVKIR